MHVIATELGADWAGPYKATPKAKAKEAKA